MPQDFCPFVGIEPFTEADRDYFFGRSREQRVIISNLYAAPLTVLYGASGVGKSSVLLAGVVPKLRDAPRTSVVVFRDWQDETFVHSLKVECAAAIADAQQEPLDIELNLPFDEFLYEATRRFQGTLLLIFDQFEEYFLYHQTPTVQAPFEAEFAKAVNREDIDANFLLSLREDGLAKLDRFKSRIPTLLANLLPLHHMDSEAAEEAIHKPLNVYNERLTDKDETVSIEDELVTVVLEQVRTGQVQVTNSVGSGRTKGLKNRDQIEAPFLQLVMTRLWEKERQAWRKGQKAGSRVLRLDTLKQLGGAQTIVRTHLSNLMKRLQGKELDLCARIFDRLVTPSGSKIAIRDKDLGKYAGDLAELLPTVLRKLSASDARILRSLPVPGTTGEQRYEIYHDVLATAILEWRSQFMDAKQETSKRKRRIIRFSAAASIMVLIIAFLCVRSYLTWREVRPWGVLKNLSTGSSHVLRDVTISIGRNADGLSFNNTVRLLPNLVSRIHFLFNKNLKAVDMRSLNGTTVNRQFLPYGETIELENGDIIVLGDIAPFQFEKISYSRYQFWDSAIPEGRQLPSKTWGLFLDLVSKKVSYLTEGRYFVTDSGQNDLSITVEKTDNWICYFGVNRSGDIWIIDRKDAVDLYAELKTGDTYTYRAGLVPPEKVFYCFAWNELGWNRTRGRNDMNETERTNHGVSQAIFRTSTGKYFRILSVVPNLEPRGLTGNP